MSTPKSSTSEENEAKKEDFEESKKPERHGFQFSSVLSSELAVTASVVVLLLALPGMKRWGSVPAIVSDLTNRTPWEQVLNTLNNLNSLEKVKLRACRELVYGVCRWDSRVDRSKIGKLELPRKFSRNRILAELQESMMLPKFDEFLKHLNSTKLRDSERQMAMFYKFCLGRDEVRLAVQKPLVATFEKIGLLQTSGPVFPTLAKMALIYGIRNSLLNFEVQYSSSYRAYYLHVSPFAVEDDATVDTPYPEVIFNSTSEVLGFIDEQLKSISNINVEEVPAAATILGKEDFFEDDQDYFSTHMTIHGQVDALLANIKSKLGTTAGSKPATFFLEDVINSYTEWHDLFEQSIWSYINWEQKDMIVVSLPDETFHIMNAIESSEKLRNVFRVYTVGEYYAKLKPFFNRASLNQLYTTDREFCYHQTRKFFPHSYEALLGREVQSPIAEQEVTMVIRMLLIAIKSVLEHSSIPRIPGLNNVIEDISEVSLFVGYPEYLDSLGSTEHAFEIESGYAINVLHVLKSQSEKYLGRLGRAHHINEDKWPVLPINTTSIHYDPKKRILVVPSSVLMYPYYVEKSAYAVILGALGFPIAREIFGNIFQQIVSNGALDPYSELFTCLKLKFFELTTIFSTAYLAEFAFINTFAYHAVLEAIGLMKAETFEGHPQPAPPNLLELAVTAMVYTECDLPRYADTPTQHKIYWLRREYFRSLLDQGFNSSVKMQPYTCNTIEGHSCINY